MQLISFDSVTVHSHNFIAFFFKSASINIFQIITFIFFAPILSLSLCMHFCNLFALFSNPKRKPRNISCNLSIVSMAVSSSLNAGSSAPLHLQEEDLQIVPIISCSIPKKELEVICELMVDFDSLEEHEFHLKEDIIFQGWTSLFAEFY